MSQEECYIVGECYRGKLYVSEQRVVFSLEGVRACLLDQLDRSCRGWRHVTQQSLSDYIGRSNMRVYRITPGAKNVPTLINRKELILLMEELPPEPRLTQIQMAELKIMMNGIEPDELRLYNEGKKQS
jgi:hypothetical protein